MKIKNVHGPPVLKMTPGCSRNTHEYIYLEYSVGQDFMLKFTEFIMGHIDEEFSNSNTNHLVLNQEKRGCKLSYIRCM